MTPARRRRAGLVPKPVVILGTGGTSIDVLDAIDEINAAGTGAYDCHGFLDDDPSLWGAEIYGLRVLGPLAAAATLSRDVFFVGGVASSGIAVRRDALIARTGVPIERFETVVHPSASVSRLSALGPGNVVLQLATVASSVATGSHVVVLPNTVLSHGCRIGDYTVVGGGVCVSSGTRVGRNCHLGARSVIQEGVTVGDGCAIGTGSIVLADLADESVVVGNPARLVRSNRDAPTQIDPAVSA